MSATVTPTSVTAPGRIPAVDEAYVPPRTSRGLYRDAWRRLLRNKLAVFGLVAIATLIVLAILAPILAPYDPNRLFPGQSYAKPSAEHWMGTDDVGRDVFSRLLYGARLSLTLALVAALGSTLIGALLGGIAGYVGGALDDVMMRVSDFVLVLPAMYVALMLRSMMPLTLDARTVFALLAVIFAVIGSPFITRGVRAIVRTERALDYAAAAASLGASHARVLVRHLLPAARGFLFVEITMLVPAFIVAEATLSYVGLGFPDTIASWGTMLQDASSISAFADFPWLLSPAAAMFLIVWSLNLTLQGRYERPM